MVNRRAKGRKTENKCKKILQKDGWLVCQVKGSTKWNDDVDFWSKFDILALRDGYIKFVQVKSNRKPPFLEYEVFIEEHLSYFNPTEEEFITLPENFSIEVWVYIDRKGFDVYRFTDSFKKDKVGKHRYDWEKSRLYK